MGHTICIYHKDCIDGTTAAAVVLRKFPEARAFPLSHGHTEEELQEILDVTVSGTRIFIVDCTFGAEEFAKRGHTVTILDHHIGVEPETRALSTQYQNIEYHFDNTKSGASLTWTYCFPDGPTPELVQRVEDNDLWVNAFNEGTQHVIHYLSLERNNPGRVSELFDIDIQAIERDGAKLTEYVHSEIDRALLAEPILVAVGEHRVPMFNITTHQSACGYLLSTKLDCAVGLYVIMGDEVRLSFRSLKHHEPSALVLAETLGGGGHKQSSGARVPLHDFIVRIVRK